MEKNDRQRILPILRWVAGLLICLCIAAGLRGMEAEASETPSSVTEQWMVTRTTESYYGPGRITFRNVRGELSGLYITKKVENESETDPAPKGDTFTFILKIGGSEAVGMSYTIREGGKRVYNYADGQTTEEVPGKMEELLETDGNGQFTLKAGQTACFEGLVPGVQWEVTEEEKSGYERTSPDTSSVGGVLQEEGASAIYTNLYKRKYVPVPDPGHEPDPEPETGSLTIEKTVSYPDYYEVPQTPVFDFTVMVGNKKLSNETYTVYDIYSGLEVATKQTDADGTVSIAGGQRAVLEGLELADYAVTEKDTAGWRLVNGKTTRKGALSKDGTTLKFSNVSASFGVSKQMEDGSEPEKEFTFYLTDGTGEPMAGAAYYLYDKILKLEDEEVHTTEEDGSFVLKARQTAIFTGIPEGMQFQVREEADAEYVQTLPTSGGYSAAVKDNVIVYPFKNKENPASTTLLVSKVVNNRSQMDISSQGYTFVVERQGEVSDSDEGGSDDSGNTGGTQIWEPVSSAKYYVGDASYRTGDEGEAAGIFTLGAGQTARFEDLEGGIYRVREVTDDLPEGFSISEKEQTGMLETSLTFTFTNTFEQNVVEKTETDPGDGVLVNVGDEITYHIKGRNYKDRVGTLTIQDKLDAGVELVEDGTTEGLSRMSLPWTRGK